MARASQPQPPPRQAYQPSPSQVEYWQRVARSAAQAQPQPQHQQDFYRANAYWQHMYGETK